MEHSLEISEKEEQQKKHYLLQSELQNMARELPACVWSKFIFIDLDPDRLYYEYKSDVSFGNCHIANGSVAIK